MSNKEERLHLLSPGLLQVSPYSNPPPSSSSAPSTPSSSSYPIIHIPPLSFSSPLPNFPQDSPIKAIPQSPLEISAVQNDISTFSKHSKILNSDDNRPLSELPNTVRFPYNHKKAKYVVVCHYSF